MERSKVGARADWLPHMHARTSKPPPRGERLLPPAGTHSPTPLFLVQTNPAQPRRPHAPTTPNLARNLYIGWLPSYLARLRIVHDNQTRGGNSADTAHLSLSPSLLGPIEHLSHTSLHLMTHVSDLCGMCRAQEAAFTSLQASQSEGCM